MTIVYTTLITADIGATHRRSCEFMTPASIIVVANVVIIIQVVDTFVFNCLKKCSNFFITQAQPKRFHILYRNYTTVLGVNRIKRPSKFLQKLFF